ncbi:MAG: terminus macrodomain insulation protein YfbV [Succinivibrio sp.]|nr:terminus macrodomain insulation protein YfbV [Succinivibrio sp.]
MGFVRTIRDGMKYTRIWPDDPLLGPVFPENRVKYFMKLGNFALPPFIVLILFWAFWRGGGLHGVEFMFAMKNTWPVTIICVLFLLFMPLQGYYWMGRRSQTKLNARQKLFYMETCIMLHRQGSQDPTLMDFAETTAEGIKKLGRDFLRKL